MIETDVIHRLAEKLADQIHQADEDGFVRQAMLIVELDHGSRETTILTASSDDRPWCQIAFLDHAADHLDQLRFTEALEPEDAEGDGE